MALAAQRLLLNRVVRLLQLGLGLRLRVGWRQPAVLMDRRNRAWNELELSLVRSGLYCVLLLKFVRLGRSGRLSRICVERLGYQSLKLCVEHLLIPFVFQLLVGLQVVWEPDADR